MKEKWTKLGKSLICLALVTSMLAGCGGGGKSSSSSGEQQVAALQVRLQQGTITSMRRACRLSKNPWS